MPDIEDGAAAPAETSLRDELSSAFDAPEPAEAPDQEPVDAPEEAPETADAYNRDDAGRFAAKEGDQPAETPSEAPDPAAQQPEPEKEAQEAQQATEAPVADPAAPPPGWSPTAKSEFATLPQTVREAIAQREVEINQGFAKLQDYKGLDPFIDMAKEAGTSIDVALNNYVNAEKLLESDPVRGILFFCETYNVDPAKLAGTQQQLQQQPQPQPQAQQQQMQPGQEQQYQQPQVDLSPLTNEINSLRQMVEGNNQERVAERTAQTTAEINTFFAHLLLRYGKQPVCGKRRRSNGSVDQVRRRAGSPERLRAGVLEQPRNPKSADQKADRRDCLHTGGRSQAESRSSADCRCEH